MRTAPSSESSASCPSSAERGGGWSRPLQRWPCHPGCGGSCPCPSCVTCCAPVWPSMPSPPPPALGSITVLTGAWWHASPPREGHCVQPGCGPRAPRLPVLTGPSAPPGPLREPAWGADSGCGGRRHTACGHLLGPGGVSTEPPAQATSRTWPSPGSMWWQLPVVICHIPE